MDEEACNKLANVAPIFQSFTQTGGHVSLIFGVFFGGLLLGNWKVYINWKLLYCCELVRFIFFCFSSCITSKAGFPEFDRISFFLELWRCSLENAKSWVSFLMFLELICNGIKYKAFNLFVQSLYLTTKLFECDCAGIK